MRKGFMFALGIMLIFGIFAFAGDKGVQKTFSGTLSCMGCDLKKDAGANSQCKIYGHEHALKMKDGSYVSFMENDHSDLLINAGDGKWHGSEIKVTGTFFNKANLIDVKSFEVKDKTFGWCAGHKNMDQCQSKM